VFLGVEVIGSEVFEKPSVMVRVRFRGDDGNGAKASLTGCGGGPSRPSARNRPRARRWCRRCVPLGQTRGPPPTQSTHCRTLDRIAKTPRFLGSTGGYRRKDGRTVPRKESAIVPSQGPSCGPCAESLEAGMVNHRHASDLSVGSHPCHG